MHSPVKVEVPEMSVLIYSQCQGLICQHYVQRITHSTGFSLSFPGQSCIMHAASSVLHAFCAAKYSARFNLCDTKCDTATSEHENPGSIPYILQPNYLPPHIELKLIIGLKR